MEKKRAPSAAGDLQQRSFSKGPEIFSHWQFSANPMEGLSSELMLFDGSLDAMANAVIALVPEAMGPYLAVITGVLSLPFTFFISNDAFCYGVVPILSQAAAEYGIGAASH